MMALKPCFRGNNPNEVQNSILKEKIPELETNSLMRLVLNK